MKADEIHVNGRYSNCYTHRTVTAIRNGHVAYHRSGLKAAYTYWIPLAAFAEWAKKHVCDVTVIAQDAQGQGQGKEGTEGKGC